MKELIKKFLKEQLEGGQEGNPLSRKEVILFKYLNKHRKDAGTQKEFTPSTLMSTVRLAMRSAKLKS